MYVEAIYYCTPAVLSIAAREIDTELVNQFIWQALDPDFWQVPYREAPSDWTRLRFEQFVGLLTKAQRRAIALTLRCLMGETESDYEPILRYWAALAGLDAGAALPEN
jgi:hypothetical protein